MWAYDCYRLQVYIPSSLQWHSQREDYRIHSYHKSPGARTSEANTTPISTFLWQACCTKDKIPPLMLVQPMCIQCTIVHCHLFFSYCEQTFEMKYLKSEASRVLWRVSKASSHSQWLRGWVILATHQLPWQAKPGKLEHPTLHLEDPSTLWLSERLP